MFPSQFIMIISTDFVSKFQIYITFDKNTEMKKKMLSNKQHIY